MPDLRLAVIEGRWFENQNTSMKSLFDLLSEIHCEHINGYVHEKFYNVSAFQDMVRDLGARRGLYYLYIAAHGDDDAIYARDDQPINRKVIRDLLVNIARTHGSRLHGIFFGSCNFVNEDTIHFFNQVDLGELRWIAGYADEINWIASTALDWCFWNDFLSNKNWDTEVSAIDSTADFLNGTMYGLCRELGFNIYRRIGNSRKFVPLIVDDDEDEDEDEDDE
jgi:hypothetical protein